MGKELRRQYGFVSVLRQPRDGVAHVCRLYQLQGALYGVRTARLAYVHLQTTLQEESEARDCFSTSVDNDRLQ